MKILEIDLPEYNIDEEPDTKNLGQKIDNLLRQNFMGRRVVIRGVASSEHDISTDELIEKIKQIGTDRYDPERTGDRYENVQGKPIDLFGFPATISNGRGVGSDLIYGFYHSAIGVHGRAMRIDVVIVYDATKLAEVPHQYHGVNEMKRDGFVFNDPKRKVDAVLGVIQIN